MVLIVVSYKNSILFICVCLTVFVAGLSSNTAPTNNLPSNMGNNLPIGAMAGNNMSNMGQTGGMGLMNPLAANMSAGNMPNNMGMGQNIPVMGAGGGGMGNMGSGLMGMGGTNTGMDNNLASNMMGNNSMLGSGMMGNNAAALGQVANMNRLGSGFGNFNNSTDLAAGNRNFAGNFGNSGGGGGGGVSGNVVQISNVS